MGCRGRGLGACAPFCPLGAQDPLPCEDQLQEWERILKAPPWEATLLCLRRPNTTTILSVPLTYSIGSGSILVGFAAMDAQKSLNMSQETAGYV